MKILCFIFIFGTGINFSMCLNLFYVPTVPELASCASNVSLPQPKCDPIMSNPQITMSTPELIAYAGYPNETHTVTSQNGYVLTLFRIPYGKKTPNTMNPTANKSVVVLMHGFLCSSSDWLMQKESNSLAYLLADAGYDVWLGNARGSKYSLGYSNATCNLDASDSNSAYWDFSFHEMGYYDVPVQIDYILNVTGQPNLYWIGHSMGNTMMYVCLSSFPEYNSKIRTLFALAPTAYNSQANNILFTLFGSSKIYQTGYEALGQKEFIPKAVQDYASYIGLACQVLLEPLCIPLDLCKNVLFLIFGYDCPQVDPQMTPVILGHTPSNESARVWAHYMQLHENQNFAPFDYSSTTGKNNTVVYGTSSPPLYDLSKVTAPVIFMSAAADNLVPPINVCQLSKKIPGLKEFIQNVGSPKYQFTHIDFLYAKNANTYVYQPILSRMKPTPSEPNETIPTQNLTC